MTHSETSPVVESGGQQRIVAAAQPLFVASGYKGVSMQQIADAAGIHKATLYHHFRDKDALFMSVVVAELEMMRADMLHAIELESTIEGRLRGLAWTFLQRSYGDFGQLMADVHTYLPEDLRQGVVRNQAFPWSQMELIFQEVRDAGDMLPLDVNLAVTLFAGVVWGQVWARKVGRETEPVTEELAGRLVDILLAGLMTSPAARVPGAGST